MQMQITEEIMNQIEVNVEGCLNTKTISVEEFVALFEERFNERVISVSYDNGIVNFGVSFEEAVVAWYEDNTIHFMESENIGEVPYDFKINLDNIARIEMVDYWLDGVFKETDCGARFAFVGKDNTEIIVDADK